MSKFQEEYNKLNKAQKQAVDAIDGPVMVIAGPGTGKTKILTLRIANILDKTDIGPEGILALTYSVNGAAEIQKRLAGIIGPAAHQVTITTFHALCESIIRDHGERFSDLIQRRLAQEADRRRLMEEIFTRAPYLKELQSFSDDPYYIGPALGAIEVLKRDGVSPAGLTGIIDKEEQRIQDAPDLKHEKGAHKGKMKADYREALDRLERLKELVHLYRDYEKGLAGQGLYDYSDMISRVRDALEGDEDLRLMLQEHYQYLLIDEHQDTNAAQNRIVELLAGFYDRPNLFIVGDEKQAIYRFQGASLENFMYFEKRFKVVKLIVLNENYRSSQSILDAAHGVRESKVPLTAKSGHPKRPILLYAASSPDEQFYGVARMVQQKIADGHAPEQIAVLYRKNTDGQEMAAMLAKLGVPYTLKAQMDVLDDPDIGRLLLLLRAVRHYGPPGPLYEALQVPWLGVPPLDVYKLNSFCSSTSLTAGGRRNPYDVIASTKLMSEAHLTEQEQLKELSGKFARWHTLALQEEAGSALETLVRESGCLASLVGHPQGQQKLAKLHAIYDLARSLVHGHRRTTLNDLMDHLAYVQDKGIRLEASVAHAPGRVLLMTAHSAKGLEFDLVYIINAYERHWPQPHRRSPLELPGGIDVEGEEQNLFYVALTRARHEVLVAWPERDRQGKDLIQSRFIALIDPSLTSPVDAKQLEKEYIENRQIRFAQAVAQAPDLADKQFLNELFLRQGLSVSALNNYLTCPWQFFYTNLVRIPEAPSVYLMYGNAVDRALERFFQLRGTGEKADKSHLLEFFNQSAHDQPFQEHELAAALKKGSDALSGWYDQWHASWPSSNLNQQRIAGIPVPGVEGVTINGKLDKIELLGDDRVTVVDYKTGKPKSRNAIAGETKSSDGNYLRQLTFYRLLLDSFRDGKFKMEKGVIDFIDPDDRGRHHREEFLITPEQVAELEAKIKEVSQEILDLAFWDDSCDDTDCRYCALRQMMKT